MDFFPNFWDFVLKFFRFLHEFFSLDFFTFYLDFLKIYPSNTLCCVSRSSAGVTRPEHPKVVKDEVKKPEWPPSRSLMFSEWQISERLDLNWPHPCWIHYIQICTAFGTCIFSICKVFLNFIFISLSEEGNTEYFQWWSEFCICLVFMKYLSCVLSVFVHHWRAASISCVGLLAELVLHLFVHICVCSVIVFVKVLGERSKFKLHCWPC